MHGIARSKIILKTKTYVAAKIFYELFQEFLLIFNNLLLHFLINLYLFGRFFINLFFLRSE